MPLVTGSHSSSTQPCSESRTELGAPLTDRLMADNDAALGEQILNVAEAEVETKVQPHGVRDDLGRKTVASVRRAVRGVGATDIRRCLSPFGAQLDNSSSRLSTN